MTDWKEKLFDFFDRRPVLFYVLGFITWVGLMALGLYITALVHRFLHWWESTQI